MSAAFNTPQTPSAIYRRVLGDVWSQLPEPVRLAHSVGRTLHGRFRISHGTRWLAGRLARWSGLPDASEDAKTELRITDEGGRERWERHFEDVAFTTEQWVSANRHLIERFNGWELEFALHAEGSALVYVQRRARLRLGRLRIRVPLLVAPRVRAKETGIGATRVRVEVNVSLPLIGLLIAYDGHLEVAVQTP